MNIKISILFILIISISSCQKGGIKCKAKNLEGTYLATFEELSSNNPLPDPTEVELTLTGKSSLVIDFVPEIGFDTEITVDKDFISIPTQIWTSESIMTYDSTKYWQLELTGTGICDNGTITLTYLKKSNFYDSDNFEFYKSGKVIFTPIED